RGTKAKVFARNIYQQFRPHTVSVFDKVNRHSVDEFIRDERSGDTLQVVQPGHPCYCIEKRAFKNRHLLLAFAGHRLENNVVDGFGSSDGFLLYRGKDIQSQPAVLGSLLNHGEAGWSPE